VLPEELFQYVQIVFPPRLHLESPGITELVELEPAREGVDVEESLREASAQGPPPPANHSWMSARRPTPPHDH